MAFWNFCHDTLGIHVYECLLIVLAAVMSAISLIHHKNQKNREKDNEGELEEMKTMLAGALAPEEGEAKAESEAGEDKI